MKKRRARVVSFAVLSTFVLTLILFSATHNLSARTDSNREFAPVQNGYVSQGENVLTYAPDRIMVKFTTNSMRSSKLSIDLQRGAPAPGAETGIASVDALNMDAGVRKVSRAYIDVKNKVEGERLGVDRWFMLELPQGTDILGLVDRYKADPNIEYAKPDYRAFPAVVPTDPMYADSWGHNNTAQLPDLDWGGTYDHTLPNTVGTPGFDANAQGAWDVTFGGSGVVIGIIDSGVDIDHPDLTLVAGYDFGDNDSNPDDDSAAPGHGTCCAGVAAADVNNGLGACGAAPGAVIMPLKVANSAGSMYFSAIENALYYAADNGADIASISLSAPISSDPATDAAIAYAYNAGVTILAATSNDNDNVLGYPAINEYVIGVGAASPCGDRKRSSSNSTECNPGVSTDPNGYTCDGERWWGSNYGSTTQDAAGAVDILGPTILPTTDIQGSGGYRSGDYEPFFNGTSCATPYVAGVCALIKTQNPSYTPAQIRDELVNSAIDVVNVESGSGWDRYSGYGMVDAEAAVGGGGPVPPVAAFSGSPTSGSYPLDVTFTDESAGAPTSWSWDFGDGVGTSTAQNPSYTYTAAGTYTVSLTATNAYGSDVESKPNYITVTEPGVTTFVTADGETSILGTVGGSYMDTKVSDNNFETITEELYTGHPRKRYSYLEHKWTFALPAGGDVTFHLEASRTNNAEGDNMVFEYSTDGANWYALATVASSTKTAYTANLGTLSGAVTVRAMDTDRTWYNTVLDVLSIDYMAFEVGDAQPQPPVANFVGSPTSGTAPLAVNFTDQSTGAPTSWSWNFGDGIGTSALQNPSYTYTNVGTYTVSLTATNENGSDGETKTNYITVSESGTTVLHVSNIAVTRKVAGPNNNGIANVTIVDQGGTPIANATVSGYFNAPNTTTKSALTGANGVALLNSDKTKSPPSDFCFTVTDVVLSGASYDPGANDVTTACESGWAGEPFATSALDNKTPSAFVLNQNSPNPFHVTTGISFGLPQSEHVMLEVYNVKGQRVAVLANQTMGAGVHTVNFDVSQHASGIYFYRLKAGSFVETKKMILLR